MRVGDANESGTARGEKQRPTYGRMGIQGQGTCPNLGSHVRLEMGRVDGVGERRAGEDESGRGRERKMRRAGEQESRTAGEQERRKGVRWGAGALLAHWEERWVATSPALR